MSNQVKLVGISEPKATKDNRQYYVAEFQDPTNPFAKTIKRPFFQQFDADKQPVWRGGDPAVIKNFVNKLLPGKFMTAEVEDYTIGDRVANIYSTVILGSELAKQVFKALGHVLKEETVVVAAVEGVEELPVI